MKKTAVVLCPGRGTYQKTELGSLAAYYQNPLLGQIDGVRKALGLATVSELDQAERYLHALHQLPSNNAALIYAAGLLQFQGIDRDEYDIVAVSGNSMGWYTTLSCAGVWDAEIGSEIVSGMASLTATAAGQQFIYPLLDEQWRVDPEKVAAVAKQLEMPDLFNSIQYGGYAVLAGSNAAVQTAMAALPPLDQRFPLLLQGHAAFHSPLMQEASTQALARWHTGVFANPQLPMIDGEGRIWPAAPVQKSALHNYTFGTQVSACYDFKKAVQVAVREFAPDRVILLGPGQNLGGAVAQSLIEIGWQGLHSKQDFTDLQQSAEPFLLEASACQRSS